MIVEKELKDFDNSFEFQKSQVTTLLNSERMMLVAAVKSSQASFTNYFDSAAPKYLSVLKQSSEFSDSWLGWLESGTTDEQLLNFFQWYLYSVIESQNSTEVKKLFEETHNDFIGKVELGVANGWLSGNVDIESVAQPVEIYINTTFENMIRDSAANYEIEDDLIKLSPLWQWSNSNEQTKFLFTHELIHA